MSYINLSEGLQNIIQYNYETFVKFILLFVFLSISAFYLLYYKKNFEKETVFYSVMAVRIIATAFSFFGLLLSPFLLFTLDPSYPFSSFIEIYVTIYGALLILFLTVVSLDFYKWLITVILRMTGIDMNSKEYSKFKRWYKTYLLK